MTSCVLLCKLEAVEGELYLLEVLEVSEVLEVMRRTQKNNGECVEK